MVWTFCFHILWKRPRVAFPASRWGRKLPQKLWPSPTTFDLDSQLTLATLTLESMVKIEMLHFDQDVWPLWPWPSWPWPWITFPDTRLKTGTSGWTDATKYIISLALQLIIITKMTCWLDKTILECSSYFFYILLFIMYPGGQGVQKECTLFLNGPNILWSVHCI